MTALDDTPTEPTEQPDEPAGDRTPEPADSGAQGSPEAAKYRRRLREAEAQRDALSERLAAAQRREVEQLAGKQLGDGADLWLTGAKLESMLTEAGDVDPAKVADAAKLAVEQRPHWAKHRPGMPGKPKEQLRGGGDPDEHRSAPTWSDVLGQG